MRLTLVPPAGWEVTGAADRTVARPPGGALVLEWSALLDLPDEPARWVSETMAGDLPPAASLGAVERVHTETELGWPLLLVEAEVLVDGAVTAIRLGAFYGFLEHAAYARIHAEDAAAYAAHETTLAALLRGAGPDFSGPLVSVAQFFGEADAPQSRQESTIPGS